MSAFYDAMQALAVRLVGQFGRPATLSRRSITVANADAGDASETFAASTVTAVFLNRSESLVDYVGGSEKLSCDKVALVAGDTDTPKIGDEITSSGERYVVVAVNIVNPGDKNVIWKAYLKR